MVLALAAYGPLVAPHDFWYAVSLQQNEAPPFAPSPLFPFGTDDLGHDLLSWVLIGARPTLEIAAGAAVVRMLVGGILGGIAGWQQGALGRFLLIAAQGSSALPATAAAVLGVIAFNLYAGPLAFALALGLIGWGEAFRAVRRTARSEAAREYIAAARALGADETRVVTRHLVPNIAPSLIQLFAFQVSAVLLLLGEIGLLRLFVGGPAVGYRSNGDPYLLPSQPDWSSMLATTRPVRIAAAPWQLLVPASALLGAVLAINFCADRLARHAQQRDVYHLVSRRTGLLAVGAIAVLLLPAVLWPGPLAPDSAFAGRVADPDRAARVASRLADRGFEGRVAGSDGASAAARYLSAELSGQTLTVADSVRRISAASIRAGQRNLELSTSLTALAPIDRATQGPLVSIGNDFALLRNRAARATLADSVLVATNSSRSALPFLVENAANVGAAALLVLDDDPDAFIGALSDVPLPVLRVGAPALADITAGTGWSVDAVGQLGPTVSIGVATETVAVRGVDVIARVPGRADNAPLIIVVAPYDVAPSARYLLIDPAWNSASAAGVLVATATSVRRAPLEADVLFVASARDETDRAGTRAALSALDPADRAHALLVITLGGLLSPSLTLQTEPPDPGAANGGFHVAGRIADALGMRTSARNVSTLGGTFRLLAMQPSTLGLFGLGTGSEPPHSAYERSTFALLSILSYIARNPEQLRP